LPERITVSEGPGLPLYAWPGLEFAEGSVNVRLFRNSELAKSASLGGVRRLVELALQRDLGWLEKDLRALSSLAPLYAPAGDSAELPAHALEHLQRYVLPAEPLAAFTRAAFDAVLASARERLPGLAQQFIDRLGPILQLRQQVQQRLGVPKPAPAPRGKTLSSLSQLGTPAPSGAAQSPGPLAEELAHLASRNFLARFPYERLADLQRYLKALLLRAERAALNPVKDQERQRQLAPYVQALKQLEAQPPRTAEARRQLDAYRWMVEEYKVSLFAQEVGTAFPVSPQRLNQQLETARSYMG
jgi:ATP-dependent helicase HrpA